MDTLGLGLKGDAPADNGRVMGVVKLGGGIEGAGVGEGVVRE